jgi:hypothetical protein
MRVGMVELGSATVKLIIALVARLHLSFWSGFGKIVVFILVLCIVILVHVLCHRVEKFSQK